MNFFFITRQNRSSDFLLHGKSISRQWMVTFPKPSHIFSSPNALMSQSVASLRDMEDRRTETEPSAASPAPIDKLSCDFSGRRGSQHSGKQEAGSGASVLPGMDRGRS